MLFFLILPEALAERIQTTAMGSGLQPSQVIHAKIPEWNVLMSDGILRWEAGLRGKSISAAKYLDFHGKKKN